MRDTLDADLVLVIGGSGAAGGEGVVGMSGDHETLRSFFDFRRVREWAGFRMGLTIIVGEADGNTGGSVTGGV